MTPRMTKFVLALSAPALALVAAFADHQPGAGSRPATR